MSATHLVAPEEVMALLDGELTAERAPFVSAHIEECAQCDQVAESVRSTSETLARWTVPSAAVDTEFEARLFDAARNRSGKHRFRNPIRTASFLRHPWVATGTLVLAACVALTLSTRFRQPETKAVSLRNMSVDSAHARAVPSGSAMVLLQPAPAVGGASDANGMYYGGGDKTESLPDNDRQSKEQEDTTTKRIRAVAVPMIAHTASVSLIVKDFGAARTSLDAILTRYRGYSAELSVATPQGAARTLQASLRVPAPQFSAAIAELKALGRVESEAQGGEEVTQQHADLVARLKNSRETEERLQAILVQRTGKISDVLAVEQEIARVRGEIEQMEGDQKSLEHRVDFATVNLTLAEEYKAQINSPSPSISTRLHNALVAGYRDVVETVVSIILFFVEYGPTLLLWFALLFPVGWFVRRRWLRAQGFGSSLPA